MEAGRVPIDKGKRVVEEICRRRGNQPSELDRFDFALAERYIALIDPGNHAVSTGVRRKLRVLDDQFKNAGWDLVLPALLEPDWTIDGFTTVKDFLCSCDDCSAFLIDYDLGVEQMTGLDVVAQLQQSDPFTPVVLFTAHDQAALFTTAVEWGVSHFLIKELSDTADRDSGDYYNHFHRLFEVLAKTDTAALAKVRYAWRSLGQLGSGAKNESAPQHGAMLEALWYLERVFFFTATAIHSAASNDIGIGLRAERVHATQRAAGIYSGRIVRELLQLYGLTDKLPESVVQDAGVEDWEIIALVTWARESRHGTSAAITESRIARFALCAARLVCACCRSWKLEFGPLPSRREGIAPPLIRGDSQRVESHRYRSVTGAVRFILGYHLSRPCNAITGDFAASLFSQAVNAAHAGASGDEMVRSALAEITIGTAPSLPAVAVPTTSVVLVDDCGNTDGWYEALRKGLEQTAVTVVEYRGRKDRKAVLNHVRRCGVALVDLRLPPAINHAAVEEEGFELLKFLREPESGTAHIPIIAFSANSDGLSARRSLAAGAQHYFTKTDSLLATALDCNNPDFFTKYRDSMLEMLRARGPGGELQMLRAMSAEVAKPERYQLMDGLPVAEGHARSLRLAQRARTVSEGFAAHLDAEINLACDLAWQERTPSAPAQWRIIRRPWPIDPQLANGSPADECSVILSSLVESLLTFAILVDAREQAAQMNPPLGRRFGHQDRIEFVKKHESAFRYASRRRGELYELNGLRNGVLHGDSSSRLARVLQLAAQLIPALLDEILHQVSLLRASGAQGQ
jgi:CheY-like chemotaxis protein